VLFNEKMLAGLGRGIVSTGKLDPEAVRRAVDEFRRFPRAVRTGRAEQLHVIATAAAREAENGMDFIHRAEEILGAEIGCFRAAKKLIIPRSASSPAFTKWTASPATLAAAASNLST
jgi:exopolyphosphatase/pppGpp-phosphohydrolase